MKFENLSAHSASCAGLTRASIHLHKMHFAKRMDCRVKPGNDSLFNRLQNYFDRAADAAA
jgi:hypothetical protein